MSVRNVIACRLAYGRKAESTCRIRVEHRVDFRPPFDQMFSRPPDLGACFYLARFEGYGEIFATGASDADVHEAGALAVEAVGDAQIRREELSVSFLVARTFRAHNSVNAGGQNPDHLLNQVARPLMSAAGIPEQRQGDYWGRYHHRLQTDPSQCGMSAYDPKADVSDESVVCPLLTRRPLAEK